MLGGSGDFALRSDSALTQPIQESQLEPSQESSLFSIA
jgi:hypothetical protein